MPRRRPVNGLDMMDDILEKAVEVAFDKGAEFLERARDKQAAALPAGATQAYTCMACKRKPFSLEQMEVVSSAVPGFGMCKGCFAFVWKAGEEKVKFLARKAQEARARGGPVPGVPEPQARPPWTILGIDQNADLDEINKAWRALAAKYHPDMVPPGPDSTAEKDAARLKFEEVTRARDVMVKLRKPAAAAG